MDIREKAKILRALSETNMPLLPAKPVVLNNFPDDRKNDIEKAIKNNAEHRAERIKSDGIRQFLDVANYKVDIDISPMLPGDIVFNSHTDFSQAKLPIDFNPQHFMEAGKDAGQGIHNLHKAGITGKGIKIAIIDEGLSDHEEYHGKIIHYEQCDDFSAGTLHGSAVASLAVGNKCGIAPDAEVYFFAEKSNSSFRKERTVGGIPKAIKRCIEINNLLPEDKKISAISCSQACDPSMKGYAEFEQMRLEAEKAGIEFISVLLFKEKGLSYGGYNRDLNKYLNSPDNIFALDVPFIDARAKSDWFSSDKNQTLLFPVEHRTAALNTGYNDYQHYALGGYSWIIPQITATYALAKQVNPNCTLEHLWDIGLKTGVRRDDLPGIGLQPEKLIRELQKEYLQSKRLAYLEDKEDKEKRIVSSLVYNKISGKNL